MNKTSSLPRAIALAMATLCAAVTAHAAIYIQVEGVEGDVTTAPGDATGDKWFIADSFSFGVEREMKESGEKGGTADINIGVGELQECTITKSFDSASPQLAQAAANGKTVGGCRICLTEGVDSRDRPACYLHFVMERCYVRSWSTSATGDEKPVEEVAFYYNKIAFAYEGTDETGAVRRESMNWDNEKNRPWPDGLIGIFDIITERAPPP